MTEKQKKFADVFLRSGDGELALREAEYKGSWTLKRVLAIDAVGAYLCSQMIVADEKEVAAFFSAVMRGEPAADEKLPGVKEQLKAAELLGKHFGMFADRESRGAGDLGSVEFVGDELL
ncbi:MAG: terminase small subunit [Oscillospiraceae bacterium]|nr:terminase small subunit [Oscillospiraceae bacterium]